MAVDSGAEDFALCTNGGGGSFRPLLNPEAYPRRACGRRVGTRGRRVKLAIVAQLTRRFVRSRARKGLTRSRPAVGGAPPPRRPGHSARAVSRSSRTASRRSARGDLAAAPGALGPARRGVPAPRYPVRWGTCELARLLEFAGIEEKKYFDTSNTSATSRVGRPFGFPTHIATSRGDGATFSESPTRS